MQPRRIATILIASAGLGFGCVSLLGGCGDESRTSGTQVQISPGDQAIDNQMRGTLKDDVTTRRKEDAENRKTKGKQAEGADAAPVGATK